MTSKVKKNKINFNGKMVSIGIDMHKRSWHITALADGQIVLAITLSRPNYNAFKKVLSQLKSNYVRIVYEAGPAGFDLYDRLTQDIVVVFFGLKSTKWGTFFTFSYFTCDVGLTMIVVLHAKTVTIRYPGGAASYYCQGKRKTKNL